MKKNIYANLDLTKSLSNFQETVTKLLELTNVKEWDGQIITFREQQIREAMPLLVKSLSEKLGLKKPEIL